MSAQFRRRRLIYFPDPSPQHIPPPPQKKGASRRLIREIIVSRVA